MERSALIKAVVSRGRELAEIERIMAQRELRQGPGAGKVAKPKPKYITLEDEEYSLGARPEGDPFTLTVKQGRGWAGFSKPTHYKDVATSVTEAYLSTLRAGGTPAEALAAREAAKAQGDHPVAPKATDRDCI